MRIVAWNCAGALHRKFEPLLALEPDIAVVSECAEPDVLERKCSLPTFSAPPIWTGRDRNKGLAVFFFNGAAAGAHGWIERDLKWLMPIEVTLPRRFNLLAVWAQNGQWRKAVPGPLRKALESYRRFLTEVDSVIAGDFNNNVIWDKPGWAMNHRDAVNVLSNIGLVSAYHAATGEAEGAETAPTIYWKKRRKHGDTYHIDYIFVPRAWTGRAFDLQIGHYDDWVAAGTGMNGRSLSDHVPLTFAAGDS